MVAAIFIVRRLVSNKTDVIDSIDTVVVNNDDADIESLVISNTIATLVANGHPLPAGYFDTAEEALSAGNLDTEFDLIMGSNRREIIA